MVNDKHNRAPHRLESDRSGHSPNAALLIDFDNVTMGVRSNLGQELRNMLNSDIIRGKVAIQRAYADWRRYPQYVVPLSEASIDLIYAPAYGSSKKNATDIRLAIDALEVVFTRPEIGTFILLSGDSDFSSLVLKLKEYGKYVIGVGMQESSSELLVQNCDEYYSYDALSGLVSAEEVTTEKHDPWDLAEKAVQKMESRNDVMRSDRLKQVMLELDSSFDEKELGYSKFNRFLTEASSRGLLELRRIGNGQYEVAAADGSAEAAPSAPSASSSAPSRSDGDGGDGGGGRSGRSSGGRGGGRPRPEPPEPIAGADSLKEAYDLLRDVVGELADAGGSVRDSEVKRRMLERNSNFDEATLGFSKFSRFLRQAHDEGVVILEKGEEGNYFLQSVGAGDQGESRPEPRDRPESRDRPEPEQPPSPVEDEEEDEEEPEPESARPSLLGRGRRGGGRGGGGAGEDAGEVVPGPASTVEEGGEDPAEADAEPAPERAPEPEDAPEPAAESPAASASGSSGRGLGRFRRGRRGGSRGEGAGPDVPVLDNVAGSASNAAPSSAGAGSSSPDREAEAGTGAAAGRPERSSEGARSGTEPSTRSTEELVEHMSRNYPGVGERTARALVGEFGGRTLEVIDREPGRVRELLPSHRAEAVLEARSEERNEAAG